MTADLIPSPTASSPVRLRRRLFIEWAGVAMFASLLVATLTWFETLSAFDNLLYDELSGIDRPAAPDDILIIAVDEDSLQANGRWPWARDRHARLFAQITVAAPKAVAFDIILSEPGDRANDDALASAIAANGQTYLPLHFVVPGENGRNYDVKYPAAPFASAAAGTGHVNLVFDRDGEVRRTRLCYGEGATNRGGNRGGEAASDEQWLHLMEQVFRNVHGQASSSFASLSDCSAPLLIPYAPRGAHSTVSYAAVERGEVPAAFLKDKVILIGATANGLGDQHPVPYGDGGTMAGVEIMANLYGGLVRGDFIRTLSFAWQLGLSLVPLWILLLGFWRWRPRTTLIASLALIAVILLTSLSALVFQLWFAPGAALAGLALIYPIWGWRRLQATSDFMDKELVEFRASKQDIPVIEPMAGPVDVVTGQAEELRNAISHMRDLRRFISDALSNLPDPMFVTNLDGEVKFISNLARSGFGSGVDRSSGSETQGLMLGDMIDRFVSADDLAEVKEYLAMTIDPPENDYVNFTSAQGQVFAMRRAAILSDSGELRGNIHYLADITALANAAHEREEVIELLSHDMRAPQAAILALLEGEASSDTNHRIKTHARRTLELADNFVGLARIKSSEFVGEEILLADLVTEASDSLWPLAKKRGITCVIHDHSDGGFILGEPSSLHRSFVNLIDNAIKYSPDKSEVDIRIQRITLDRDNYIAAKISDQGGGIAEDMLETLFQRFAHDSAGASGMVKGAGLGLSFVAAVVERHGGTVSAENARNGGACFTVLLPAAPEDQA